MRPGKATPCSMFAIVAWGATFPASLTCSLASFALHSWFSFLSLVLQGFGMLLFVNPCFFPLTTNCLAFDKKQQHAAITCTSNPTIQGAQIILEKQKWCTSNPRCRSNPRKCKIWCTSNPRCRNNPTQNEKHLLQNHDKHDPKHCSKKKTKKLEHIFWETFGENNSLAPELWQKSNPIETQLFSYLALLPKSYFCPGGGFTSPESIFWAISCIAFLPASFASSFEAPCLKASFWALW